MDGIINDDLKLLVSRVHALECMEFLARQINDERIFETWLMGGVPDDADKDMLYDIAEDDESFYHVCRCFGRVIGSANTDEHGGLVL